MCVWWGESPLSILCMHLPEVSGCCSSPLHASQAAFPHTPVYIVVAKPSSHIPPVLAEPGSPTISCSPLLNAFWPHPVSSPAVSPSSSLRSAAWPGGGTVSSRQRPPRPGAGAGDTRLSPPPAPGGGGGSASQAEAGITQTPLPALLPGDCHRGGAGKNTPQPPKFSSPKTGDGARRGGSPV